jgi:N-methylhydantoinase A
MDGPIRLGVDVGGTFTDVVLLADGEVTTAKVPTTDDQSRGVLDGIEVACEAAGVDPAAIERFRHAMTVSVNAILEGTGATTALVTTEGFGDVLEIGRQDRPALYDLSATKPEPLVPRERRYEIDERASPTDVERPAADDAVAEIAAALGESGVESVAVSLLHAYANPENERRVAEWLRAELDCPVSVSHEVLAEFREYERTATTVADAYVGPVIDDYLGRLESRAAERGLPTPRVMQANGGIAATETVRDKAVTTVLSGPAAGVVGASLFEGAGTAGTATASADPDRAGHAGLVTFDMGGTSSDVSLVREGTVERTTEATVGGHPVRIPMVDVNTVGAGGGSIAWVDAGGALRVGPRSAGANPGPACYDRGGDDPTVTDADLLLGYLGADTTLGAGLELDQSRAEAVCADLAAAADLDDATAAARGVFEVANATMTRAIRGVTVERGHDPRRFALAAFGGAGPMHAAALADRLDIGRVVVPRAEGVLSALGLLAAEEKHDAVRTHRTPLTDADAADLDAVYAALADDVLADTTAPDAATVARYADLRYAGQSFELTVSIPDPFDAATARERFHEAHEHARGYRLDEPVSVISLRATATVPADPPTLAYDPTGDPKTGERPAFFDGGFRETPVYDREQVPVDRRYDGPAVFEGRQSTVVLPPDWTAVADEEGTLVLDRAGGTATAEGGVP